MPRCDESILPVKGIKKYCSFCQEMHELKDFSPHGSAMYLRNNICRKGAREVGKINRAKRKQEKDFYNQFLPI